MHERLWTRGFVGLAITQFLGAANDNILKFILTMMVVQQGIWEGRLAWGGTDDGASGGAQGVIFLLFVVPFILLSALAGTVNDRMSKSRVALLVKIAEVPIATLAGIGFWTQNLWLTLGALLLLTTQSTFFGPAKYGMIPELVGSEKLSKANGLISMMTNIAVIVGNLLGAWVSVRYCVINEDGPQIVDGWMPLVALVSVAVLGVFAAMLLPKLQAGDKGAAIEWNPFATYYKACVEMNEGPLLLVVIAWAFFYLFAGLALLIIPEYKAVLGVDDQQISYIMAGLGIAIGIGSTAAGFVSGNRIEPRLVPVGAAGLCVGFALLGLVQPSLVNVMAFIGSAGFFAGFYLIPLQALVQQLAPPDERGRFIATSHALSNVFLAAASVLYIVISGWFSEQPYRIFLVAALLLAVGSGVLLFGMRGLVWLKASREAEEAD